MRKALPLLIAAAVMAACSNQDAPAPESQQSPMSRILQPEMIGASLQYLEALTGPPLHLSADGSQRKYKLGACEVDATVEGGENKSVSALRVALAPGCDADVGAFLATAPTSKSLPLSQMSFGKFKELAGGTLFYADCLSGCGNAYEPAVYAHWEGPRAADFLEMMVEVKLVDDAAIDAASQWRSAMESGEGEDWVMEASFNCDPSKYNEIASKAFAAVRPEAFSIGRGLAVPRCSMQQAQSQQAVGVNQVRVPQPATECDYDYGKTLKQSGLVAKQLLIHGPEDEDFAGYGCPYRITPAPGTTVQKGSTVQYRSAYEGG